MIPKPVFLVVAALMALCFLKASVELAVRTDGADFYGVANVVIAAVLTVLMVLRYRQATGMRP